MAASLAFGILFATIITLFLIPSLYMILDDFSGWWREAWSHVLPGKAGGTETVTLARPDMMQQDSGSGNG
jgi:hypothetical protein